MTVAAKPIFIDTNVLVYASVDSSPFHRAARKALEEAEGAGHQLWISRQVQREFLATLLRPRVSISVADVVNAVRAFERRFEIAEDGPLVTERLLALLASGFTSQIHDTNIVATMLVYGIDRILTNNPSNFAPFASYVTTLPL